MSSTEDLAPLPTRDAPAEMHADTTTSGQYIQPIERIRLFDADQWEEFVEEWANSFREDYCRVDRAGGAGDMGRDVVASCDERGEVWDNFQCKHYAKPLTPTNVWSEFGKLIHYCQKGEFTYPDRKSVV